jgi:hypothetical protein
MVDEPNDFIAGDEAYNPHDPADVAKQQAAERDALKHADDAEAQEIEARQMAFRRVFNIDSADVRLIMKDLRPFCRADSTTFQTNERYHVLLTGRQEVYLRIMDYVLLPLGELIAKRKGE